MLEEDEVQEGKDLEAAVVRWKQQVTDKQECREIVEKVKKYPRSLEEDEWTDPFKKK